MTAKIEDYLYVITRRTINGETKRYIERMASRQVEDYRLDGLFLDSFLSYNGISVDGSQVTLTSGGGWEAADEITVTCDTAKFDAGDVGNGVTVWVPGGAITRITITAYDSPTVVRGNPSNFLPAATPPAVDEVDATLRDTATVNWSLAVDVVANLDHLEGEDVSILANGVVLSGTVSGGEVSLGGLYDIVHVGLPITADFETLDLDSATTEVRDKQKLVRSASILVDRSRGTMQVGPDEDHLRSFRPEAGSALATDIFGLTSGDTRSEIVKVTMDASWRRPGRVFLRLEEPLPLAILGIIPAGKVGG